MPNEYDGEIVRRLRRQGRLQVRISIEPTLFGPLAMAFSIRRVEWQVRNQSWMFKDLEGACEQVDRLLNGNRQLLHRFALILEEGVWIDISLPSYTPELVQVVCSSVRRSLEKNDIELHISQPGDRHLHARLQRMSPSRSETRDWSNKTANENIVQFPKRPLVRHDASTPLGVAFVDEPKLTALAARLYPLGIRSLRDLGQGYVDHLHRIEINSMRRCILVLLEGWMIENNVDFA